MSDGLIRKLLLKCFSKRVSAAKEAETLNNSKAQSFIQLDTRNREGKFHTFITFYGVTLFKSTCPFVLELA